MIWQIVGILASVLTMFSFVPQIIMAFKTRSLKDLSIVTLVQFALGVSLWALYGLYLKDAIIITANIITLITLLILLALYFKFRSPPQNPRVPTQR